MKEPPRPFGVSEDEIRTRRELPNPPTDPPPPAESDGGATLPDGAPWVVEEYRAHTDGLTRRRLTTGAYVTGAGLLIAAFVALLKWCAA